MRANRHKKNRNRKKHVLQEPSLRIGLAIFVLNNLSQSPTISNNWIMFVPFIDQNQLVFLFSHSPSNQRPYSEACPVQLNLGILKLESSAAAKFSVFRFRRTVTPSSDSEMNRAHGSSWPVMDLSPRPSPKELGANGLLHTIHRIEYVGLVANCHCTVAIHVTRSWEDTKEYMQRMKRYPTIGIQCQRS